MEAGRARRALTREAEELAALYGAEARRLFCEHSWEQLEPTLAEGWRRIRGGHALDWPQVRPRVHAAWLAARGVERRCG
ncbi:hypothetical protein ACFOED_12565 [Vulcaniibacterium thermophilum]|jgi:hypothetical protein|uniref:Uncharacterized protein n=1 Tax=Vulcaniibacterium thermophilum TaxID=1169913 RepID=A0A918Z3I6_9GAMM|nr:hypothetical protein [Vulcaniibacterium thermophilum]GHE36300.1 hypothetical protein GCM10007167_18080 [Vulcaniibacterium thermophilum]